MLIIPTIPIVHGVCGAQIASLAHEVHHADRDIYSQSPVDRARLFRKENAKMLHLQFHDSDPWENDSLAIIRAISAAVDIPLGLAPSDDPPSEAACEALFDAGIYRIWMPEGTPDELLFAYGKQFGARRIIPTADLSFDFETELPRYRQSGIDRVGIDISRRDTLEMGTINWPRLAQIGATARAAGIHLTALHGVRGYPELKRLQDIGGAFDSLVLCRALNENRFPCQLIWRDVEAEAAFEATPMNNLWSNPLEGKPHI